MGLEVLKVDISITVAEYNDDGKQIGAYTYPHPFALYEPMFDELRDEVRKRAPGIVAEIERFRAEQGLDVKEPEPPQQSAEEATRAAFIAGQFDVDELNQRLKMIEDANANGQAPPSPRSRPKPARRTRPRKR